ncbi:MAG: hypothetical protein ACRENG_17480 [bacterium]
MNACERKSGFILNLSSNYVPELGARSFSSLLRFIVTFKRVRASKRTKQLATHRYGSMTELPLKRVPRILLTKWLLE